MYIPRINSGLKRQKFFVYINFISNEVAIKITVLKFIFQVIGQICTMSSVQLRRLGIVAYTLSDNEISCLENLDDDAVASLGTLSEWSQTQV